jgi:hypothetical protein
VIHQAPIHEFRNRLSQKKVNMSLGFQLNHFRTMGCGSHDDRQSGDTGAPSYTRFAELLHEVIQRTANALANGAIPEQAPD